MKKYLKINLLSVSVIFLCASRIHAYAAMPADKDPGTLSGNVPAFYASSRAGGLSAEAIQYCADNGLTLTDTNITAIDPTKVPEVLNIPEGITAIWMAYFNTTSLKEITFPSTFKEIAGPVFQNVTTLEKVDMGKCSGLQALNMNNFQNCANLHTVILPEGLTNMGSNSFYNCPSLESVNIPSTVTMISGSFQYCTSLKSVDLSSCASLTALHPSAFRGCSSLTDVKLPSNMEYVGISAFSDCTSLASIELPDNINTLEMGAFANSGLTSVTLPAGLTTMKQLVFSGCDKLSSVDITKVTQLTAAADGALAIVPSGSDPASFPALTVTVSKDTLAWQESTPWMFSAFRWYASGDSPASPANAHPAVLKHFILDMPADGLYSSWNVLKELCKNYSDNTGYPLPENVYAISGGVPADMSELICKEILADAYLGDFQPKTSDELWNGYKALFQADTAKAADIYGIVSSAGAVSYDSFMDYCLRTLNAPDSKLPSEKTAALADILQRVTEPIVQKAAALPQSPAAVSSVPAAGRQN